MKSIRNGLAAVAAGGLALAAVAMPAFAAKDSMTLAFQDKFLTMEPYQTSARQMLQMAYMIWDPLVLRDPDSGELLPHVATKWSNPESTVWEFDIRNDITFHTGNKLTAESIRYTIEDRILDPEINSPRLPNFKWIKSIEVVDEDTFRIHTNDVYPVALQVLNTLYIMDEKWAAEQDFNYIQEHAMGSGPFQWVEWNKGSNIVLKRNPNYWMDGVPAIDNVTIKIIPETATRLAELFAGSVDFAMNLQLDQLPSFEGRPDYEVLEGKIIRIDFWQFDSLARAGETPVADVRVRKAIAHAINRDMIVERLVGRGGYKVNVPMSPYHFGVAESDGWYEYDPEKAKELLAAAGYPDGFEIDLWQYSAHQNLPNQAAMQMLAKVGIKVNLKSYIGNTQQMGRLRRGGQITGIGNFNWGSYNIFDADAILFPWFDMESSNNYSGDQELSDILTKARYSVDPEFRKEQYAKAQEIIKENAYWMPFFGLVRFYGKSVDLDIKVGLDEVPRFQFAKWKN